MALLTQIICFTHAITFRFTHALEMRNDGLSIEIRAFSNFNTYDSLMLVYLKPYIIFRINYTF